MRGMKDEGARVRLGGLGLLLCAGLALGGCDAGGLLQVEDKGGDKPPVKASSGVELVNGGTRASNAKYKVFYVVGQPTPLQGVSKSPDARVNGGLAGAVHSD